MDPYGLFFVSAHWYLAAFDRTRDGVRNFRLSRMSGVVAGKKKSQYDIPATFRLREHSTSRNAWDLGDAEQHIAEVEFIGNSGALDAAERQGEAVSGRDRVRRFPIRRTDVFARWLLSFGGDAKPLSPPALVTQYQTLARETLALYERGA